MIRHLIVWLPRTLCEAHRDGTLGVICRRNARVGFYCFRRRASRTGFLAAPGRLPTTVVPIGYSIGLRPEAESLALPGVELIDIEVRDPAYHCGEALPRAGIPDSDGWSIYSA
jgi:hypothetical protein